MSCEEWMARLRHSVSGEPGRKSGPELVTVGEFHRECVRVAARLQAGKDVKRRGSSMAIWQAMKEGSRNPWVS